MSDRHECDEKTHGTVPSGDEMSASLLLDTADLIDDDRDTHGDAVENQQHIAAGWTWYLRGKGVLGADEELHGDDVASMMAMLKMSRHVIGTPDMDHMRDIAGYAGIGGACLVDREVARINDLTRGAYKNAHDIDDE